MRIFEILLLLSVIYVLLSMWIPKLPKMKITQIIVGASVVLLALHLIIEGFRWQMLIIYLATLLFCIIYLRRYLRRSMHLDTPKRIVVPYILLSLFICVSVILSICLPVFNSPKLTGVYPVGTQTMHLVDESRLELYSADKNDKRELMVQVWYPAQDVDGKQRADYIPGGIKMIDAQATKALGVPEILLDYFKYSKSNAYEGDEISSASERYPMIFLNHGLGTNGFLHTSLAETLASHGFMVVAIDFTHSTAATIFPDGKITYDDAPSNTTELKNELMKVWTEDIKFVLDQFEKMNSGGIPSDFAGKIDMGNIGICGHSFGGGASFLVHNSDTRIKAGVDMDGSLVNFENMQPSDVSAKPFMFMFSDSQWGIRSTKINSNPTNEELKKMNTTMEEYEQGIQRWKLENDLVKNAVEKGGCEIYIKNTEHYNFTDFQLISPLVSMGIPGMTGKINGERGNYIVNQYVLDFFNKYLKNKGGNLLNGPSKEFPEVNFEYYNN